MEARDLMEGTRSITPCSPAIPRVRGREGHDNGPGISPGPLSLVLSAW